MREILFRGKTTDRGEWVQGCYIETLRYNNLHWIWNGKNHFTVSPETIGQYTGLTDKNGTKIFEGDIVCVESQNYEVKYLFAQFFVGINMPIAYKRFGCEVIGNIHDNPELLES